MLPVTARSSPTRSRPCSTTRAGWSITIATTPGGEASSTITRPTCVGWSRCAGRPACRSCWSTRSATWRRPLQVGAPRGTDRRRTVQPRSTVPGTRPAPVRDEPPPRHGEAPRRHQDRRSARGDPVHPGDLPLQLGELGRGAGNLDPGEGPGHLPLADPRTDARRPVRRRLGYQHPGGRRLGTLRRAERRGHPRQPLARRSRPPVDPRTSGAWPRP